MHNGVEFCNDYWLEGLGFKPAKIFGDFSEPNVNFLHLWEFGSKNSIHVLTEEPVYTPISEHVGSSVSTPLKIKQPPTQKKKKGKKQR